MATEIMTINVKSDVTPEFIQHIGQLAYWNNWKNVVVVARTKELDKDEWNERNYTLSDLEKMPKYFGLSLTGHVINGIY
jgi:hypothetical protein